MCFFYWENSEIRILSYEFVSAVLNMLPGKQVYDKYTIEYYRKINY